MSESLGSARVDFAVDTHNFDATITAAKNQIRGLSEEARKQYDNLNAAEKRRIDSLLKQANTIGLTRQQQILYNAALKNTPTAILDELKNKLAASSDEAKKATSSALDYHKALKLVAAAAATYLTGTVFAKFIAETKKAEQEQLQLAAVLRSTGNAAGWTQQQLNAMAESLSSASGKSIFSVGDITKAQTNLAEFTNIVGTQYPKALQAAIDMASRKGMDLASATEQIGRALDVPSQGLSSLTRQGFRFTEEQKKLIEQLEQTGKVAEAQQIILDALESSYGGAGEAARNSFGGSLTALQHTIDSLLTGDSGSMQAMRGSVEDLIRQLNDPDVKNAFASFVNGLVNIAQAAITAMQHVVQFTQFMGDTFERFSGTSADPVKQWRINIEHARSQIDSLERGDEQWEYLTDQQRSEMIAGYRDSIDSARRSIDDWQTTVQYPAFVRGQQNVSNNIVNPALTPATPVVSGKGSGSRGAGASSASQRMLDQLAQRYAEINAQQQAGSDKLLASEKELVRFEQQIADLRGRSILTADQKSLLANEQGLRVALERNVAAEKALQLRQEQVKLEQDAAKQLEAFATKSSTVLAQSDVKRQQMLEQYQSQLDVMGLGSVATERVNAQAGVYKQYRDMFDDLAEAADKARAAAEKAGTPFDAAAYEEARRLLNEQLALQLEDLSSYYAAVDQKQADWTLGVKAGLADFASESKNMMQAVAGVVQSSLNSTADALTEFTMTGATDFKSLANSIIEDLIRIQYQKALTGLFGDGSSDSGFLGSAISGVLGLFGGGSSLGSSAASGLSSGFFSGLIPSAKGNVFNTPGLSAYSNSIVSKPTIFPFAKGGALGLMGEAGPEAIMPLRRGSDGRLGVQVTGGGGSGNISVITQVYITESGASSQTTSDGDSSMANKLGEMVTQQVRTVLVNERRPGGMLWGMQNGR